MANYQLSATLSVKDQMTAKLRAAQKEAEKLTRGVGSLKDQDLKWRVGVEGVEKLKRLREEAKAMKFSPIKIRAQDEATPKVSKLRAELSSLTNKMNTVRVNVQTVGGEKLRGLKNSLNEIASGALMASGAGMLGVAGIGFGMANMLETYRATEYQFVRNKALFTNGMDEMQAAAINKDLMATVRKYGATTPYTNAEVGKMLEYEAMAGWKPDVAQAALPSLINTALVSGEDPKMVADVLTDGMTAMGYTAGTFVKNAQGELVEAAKHFSDVMARTTMTSNTTMNQLGYAQKYVAPLARAMGMDVEEMDAFLGVAADNGIKADMGGTGLRGVLMRLIKEPKQTALALDRMGVHLFDENTGEQRQFINVMKDLSDVLHSGNAEKILDAFETMSDEPAEYNRGEVTEWLRDALERGGGKLTDKDFMQLATSISGTYALAPFLAWMNNMDAVIAKYEDLKTKSDGTGERFAKEMMNTFHGDIKTLQSAWEDLNYEMFEGGASSGIRNFLQGLIADINAFKNSLKDGFDLSDIFGLVSNIITQLKNKFLELDGIGSILAGGILMTGMKKLYSQALSLRNGLKDLMKTTAPSTLSAKTNPLSQVGTMNVQAGVVNVNGKVVGSKGGGVVGGNVKGAPVTLAAAKQSADTKLLAARNQSAKIAAQERSVLATQKYYAQKEQAAGLARADAAIAAAKAERLSAIRTNGAFAGIMTGLFGAMDVAAVKSQNQNRLTSFDEELSAIRKSYEELKAAGAPNEQLANTLSQIQEMESQRATLIKESAQAEKESLGGAAGATLGSMAGAMLGSMIGPVGTMLGGIIGAAIGDYLGTKAAGLDNGTSAAKEEIPAPSVADFRQADEAALQSYREESAARVKSLAERQADVAQMSFEEQAALIHSTIATAKRQADWDSLVAENKKWRAAQDVKIESTARTESMARVDDYLSKSGVSHYQGETPSPQPVITDDSGIKMGMAALAGGGWQNAFDGVFQTLGAFFPSLFATTGFFGGKAEAAELNEEQLLQQAAMEQGFPPQVAENNFEEQLAAAQSFKDSYQEIFSGMGEELSSIFDGLTEQFSTFGEGLSEGFTSTFESLSEQFTTFGEGIAEGFTSTFESLSEQFSTFGEGISEGFTSAFENVGEIFSTFGEQINSGMASAQAAVESSVSTMKSSFDSGLQSIQSSWSTLPGFFEGILGGLGGIAAAAGSAIAAGLTAPIGGIVSAWQGAAAQISAIISSISAQAASVGSISVGGIGQNYLGTSSWEGGLTTINEHGGEIIDLPSGTRIYPHATTLGLLKDEIKNRFDTAEPTFSNLPTLPPFNFSMPDFKSDSSSSTTNNSSNATFNFGGVNINSGMDFDEFADRLQRLLKMGQLNSARA